MLLKIAFRTTASITQILVFIEEYNILFILDNNIDVMQKHCFKKPLIFYSKILKSIKYFVNFKAKYDKCGSDINFSGKTEIKTIKE